MLSKRAATTKPIVGEPIRHFTMMRSRLQKKVGPLDRMQQRDTQPFLCVSRRLGTDKTGPRREIVCTAAAA